MNRTTVFGFEAVQSRAGLKQHTQAGKARSQRRENSSGSCRMQRVSKEGRGEQQEVSLRKMVMDQSDWNKRSSGR